MRTPTKPVKRVYDLGERRPLVVTFNPDGTVTFREKHRRKVFKAHLRSLFMRAVQYAIEDEKQRRKTERAARRAARS